MSKIVDRFIQIQWQDGTVPEHGVNGAQIEDVIGAVIEHLEVLDAQWPSLENQQTLRHLWSAIDNQRKRTARRVAAGIEGMERPR